MGVCLNPVHLWETMGCMPKKVRGYRTRGCLKILHRNHFTPGLQGDTHPMYEEYQILNRKEMQAS